MNSFLRWSIVVAGFAAVCWLGAFMSPRLYADELKAIDFGADVKKFDGLFGKYGYQPTQTMIRDKEGIRFRLPAAKDVDQTGIYSFFVLTGDFEVSANYEIINLTPPKGGYGVSCGIAVEAKEPGAPMVSVARGQQGKASGYVVTKKFKDESGEMKYQTTDPVERSQAKTGRLVLKREKNEIVVLVADKPKDEPRELERIPFSTATIKTIRLFADTGGSPTALEARLTNLQVRGSEVTAGQPLSEAPFAWGWWLTLLGAILLPFLAFWYWRHRREEE